MGHNRQPHINASRFRHSAITLNTEGRVTALICPGCSQWRTVKRHLIEPHTCPSGGQRIWNDLDLAAWMQARYERACEKQRPETIRVADGKPRHRHPHGDGAGMRVPDGTVRPEPAALPVRR